MLMCPKIAAWDADGVDPDQLTAVFYRVWSGPTLFAQVCLSKYSENILSLYSVFVFSS